MHAKKIFAIILCGLMSVQCAPQFRAEFYKLANEKHYTEDQKLASYYYSFRLLFGRLEGEDHYSVVYSRLPKSEVTKQLDGYLKDLASILEYNNPEWNQYLKTFKLRPYFIHQEEIFKAVAARNRTSELNDTFRELMGEQSHWGMDPSMLGYDGSVFYIDDMRKAFPFTGRVIEEAKENGLLQVVETYKVSHRRQFDHKEPDPQDPTDQNKFIWRSKEYSLDVTIYKIIPKDEKPQENFGNYLEAYRVVDGKRESAPALKAFLDGKGSMAIAVIDTERETEAGFGLPNSVDKITESSLLNEDMLTKLFPDDLAYKRNEPVKPDMHVEIARVGQKVEVWEKASDAKGWEIPFTYQKMPVANNYNVRIKFKQPKPGEKHGLYHEIEFIEKEWTNGDRYTAGNGRVVERYKVKAPLNSPVVKAQVLAQLGSPMGYSENEVTKAFTVVFVGGDVLQGTITPGGSKFIADKPTEVEYTMGDKRYLLRDDDGDGKYEKRRQVSPPKDQVGMYEKEGDESAEITTLPVPSNPPIFADPQDFRKPKDPVETHIP